MAPIISIIIPCYNHGQYIQEAISSIEKSAGKSPYEIIIIDDGSSDEYTINVLNSLEEKGYHILKQENQGLAKARNNGISVSKGAYFLPLDADNIIKPEYIENGINILDSNPSVGIVYGNSRHFGDENRIFKPGRFSMKKLLVKNYIDACAIIRKQVWQDINGYDSNLSAFEDWDMNLSAAAAGWKFHYIPEIMFEYRILSNSMLRSHPNLQECIDYIAKKHGVLYRNEFLKTITISNRLKSSLYDLYKKLTGKPNY